MGWNLKTILPYFKSAPLNLFNSKILWKNKVKSLQSSWIKRLYNDCFHEWKIISLYQLNKTFGPSFKFHSNLSLKKSSLKKLLPFYRHMLICWSQSLSGSPETSSQILSQFLWFNKYIKIEDTIIHFPKFSNKGKW